MTSFFSKLIEEFQLPLHNPILVFSLILFIILLSPILLKKLNIPSIIGLILAGVIIGPHGLYILENNSAIKLFSTIGLLYIMFMAGLELDLNEFKVNKNKSLVFGFFTFIIPILLGFPVMYYLLGYDFNASFLTASMFATHTLVAYPIVSKLGIAKNQAVAVTVGGTILTDTAVLIILAVIMGNSQGTLDADFWIRLGVSLVVFFLILFLLIPRIAKWFFAKMEAEKHLHYIFVLTVVFFSAFLAEIAGVEPIIGAFFAGLALNKLIPHSSALMNRIEFIGNSLFIPFFLISVGMLVNTKVIFNGPMALVIALVLSVVALTSKYLAAWITQVSFAYTKSQRNLIFGLSGAHAAATLAVILVGYQAFIIDDNILNGTIILILITCVIASLVTEKAGKKVVEEDKDNTENLLKSSPASKEQILLSFNSTANIEKLLELAILVKDKKSPNPVSMIRVVSNDKEAEAKIVKAKKELEAFVDNATATETKVDILTTIDQSTHSGISRISREIMADIILLDWTDRSNPEERDIEKKINFAYDNPLKTVGICHIERPLTHHGKIIVVAPPHAESESGFKLWVNKLGLLARELSVSILLFSDDKTESKVQAVFKTNKISATLNTLKFNAWDDFFSISKYINKNDLIVLISSRKGGKSYLNNLEGLPEKLEKYYPNHSQFIIYPKQDGITVDEEPVVIKTEFKKVSWTEKVRKGLGALLGKN